MFENGTMTRKMASEYLHISLPALDALLRRSENPIPCVRVGRRYIIPVAGLEQWLAEESHAQSNT